MLHGTFLEENEVKRSEEINAFSFVTETEVCETHLIQRKTLGNEFC